MVCRETSKCLAILPTAMPSSNICLTLAARIAAVSRRRLTALSRPLSRSALFTAYLLASADYTILYYILPYLSSLFYIKTHFFHEFCRFKSKKPDPLESRAIPRGSRDILRRLRHLAEGQNAGIRIIPHFLFSLDKKQADRVDYR